MEAWLLTAAYDRMFSIDQPNKIEEVQLAHKNMFSIFINER